MPSSHGNINKNVVNATNYELNFTIKWNSKIRKRVMVNITKTFYSVYSSLVYFTQLEDCFYYVGHGRNKYEYIVACTIHLFSVHGKID